MSFLSFMSREEMVAAVAALDQALHMHEQWCNQIYATLICGLAPDERDVSPDAHHHCTFGQWYYVQHGHGLAKHPGFHAAAMDHERMHQAAAALLLASQAREAISVEQYDQFVHAVTTLRTEIVGLRHELAEGLANVDPLTGATSRIGMLTKLRGHQEFVKRDLQSCTITMIDLDAFKAVNDSYGHPAGDAVLREIVQRMLTDLRPYDELFRYGGEEFLLSAPGTDLESGLITVERLRAAVADAPVDAGGGRSLHVTASFGLTVLDPDVPVEESIARADKALYRAKAEGRNCCRVWELSA